MKNQKTTMRLKKDAVRGGHILSSVGKIIPKGDGKNFIFHQAQVPVGVDDSLRNQDIQLVGVSRYAVVGSNMRYLKNEQWKLGF